MSETTWPPEFMARIAELLQSGDLQIPPPIFLDMEAEFVAYNALAQTLTVRFPVQPRYQNAMGYMQGGMIAAAVDNVIGPLSFMVAPPNVTKTLEMTYLRPIPPSLEAIIVEARLLAVEGRELLFAAEVRREPDTVLAKALARHHTRRPREKQ
jgi:acyl-coenzyme A thioesterase PaaI-like protein